MTATPDNKQSPSPSESPKLYIDAGITFTGSIKFDAKPTDVAVIKGKVIADIDWPGRVMVCDGGELVIKSEASIRDLQVSGKLSAESPDARVVAGFVRATSTAHIELGSLSLPPGGLEQVRGAVLNASLRMSAENPYTNQEDTSAAAARSVVKVVDNTRPQVAASVDGQGAASGQGTSAPSERSYG